MIKVRSTEFVKSCVSPDQYPRERLREMAFIGRSNVGKSSGINSLLNSKKLAKVSSTPGKTQTLNFFLVDTDDGQIKRFYVVDLPGYGYAKVPQSIRSQWGPMIEQYLSGRNQLCGVVFFLDSRRIDAQDQKVTEWLRDKGLHVIWVATKVDKLKQRERQVSLRHIRDQLKVSEPASVIFFSAKSHEGRNELWREIRKVLTSARDGEDKKGDQV